MISLKSRSNLDFMDVLKNYLYISSRKSHACYCFLVYITKWMLGVFDPGSDFNCCVFLIVFSCHPCNSLHCLFDVNTARKTVKMQH